ncbi:hypothetical protein AZ54_22395 [Xanthomonas oryzae pv. oryzae PXO86]|nr:hypothetical protein AZ54_22395 [Xanthomonas oryzae pv. oryzae PXO86]
MTTCIFVLGLLLWIVSIASVGVGGYKVRIIKMQQQIEHSR